MTPQLDKGTVQPAKSKASPDQREAPLVKPAAVQINDAGQIWRSILVRMPQGAVPDDLRDPKIWRAVQASPRSALIRMDRLFVLAYDESWGVEALVKHATNSEVRLLVMKVFEFAGVSDNLYRDDTLEVFWGGGWYGVRRIDDHVAIATGFSTEGQAIEALRRSYPRVGR
ncbi:MAG TPA: hypothetical protein VNK52_14325 [Hyphomicrobiaceae bacterium]|nr:hypothetical protein [Hyphomicrobiaceae bacterium]